MSKEALDLDGGVVEVAERDEPVVPTGADRDIDGVPYCVKHHCRMTQYSGKTKSSARAYYRCPVPDCKATAKVVKLGQRAIPSAPMECPECRNHGQTVYLERMPDDRSAPSQTSIRLWCPVCEYKVGPLALPHQSVVHAHQSRRAGVRDIGER